MGRKRGLKFNVTAAQRIGLEAQRLDKELGKDIDFVLIPVIIYWGLWANCYVKREDPDFTFEDVSDWVDSNMDNTEVFREIIRAFFESKQIGGQEQQGVDEKKSSTSQQRKAGKSSARMSPGR